MSLQQALRFIETAGRDVRLRERLRIAGRGVALAEVVELARDAGYVFTEEELLRAFAQDWHMRRRFYGATSNSAKSSYASADDD